jgi:D-alanyl-lipoteichoic acid acyltransferase DltB (MBOAT superfamily)
VLFNSLTFLLFFPLCLLGYYICPARLRHYFLLFISAVFYMWWNPYYIALLYTSIILTYLCGLVLGKVQSRRAGEGAASLQGETDAGATGTAEAATTPSAPPIAPPATNTESLTAPPTPPRSPKNRRIRIAVIAATLTINLALLAIFKYNNFAAGLINKGFAVFGLGAQIPHFDIILPVGISFFTFQALGYIIDVYRGQTAPERNFAKYALFVSFFPQMVAGPIERSKNLLSQIRDTGNIKVGAFDDIYHGLVAIIWGFFMKVVISDRIAILVDTVYDSWWNYGATELSAATVGFALQIYCDFWAYSIIALGAARMMGFKLMVNFEQPYFARSIREFWRRWHISLSSWFKDYLYIPLGGNRKGKWRKRLNVMIVFIASGLWHGANISFAIWGFLHGAYQVIGDITHSTRTRIKERLHVKTETFSYRLFQVLFTFIIVNIAWVFFRADSFTDALGIFTNIFGNPNPWQIFNGALFNLGIDRPHMNALILAIVVLFLADRLRYRKGLHLSEFLRTQNVWFRWAVVLGLFMSILVFGAYGPEYDAKQFIYFQF